MKNNLGKTIVIFLLLLQVQAMASTYMWSAKANKKDVVVNEAIYLKYICAYDDLAELYSIEFNPMVDNDTYKIKMLSEREKIQNGKKINIFEFVAFVKKTGKIEFAFETIMEKTNKDSIQNTVLGRDNSDYEEFSKVLVKQKSIVVNVSESLSDLVGTFNIEVKKEKSKLKSYEPYHLELIVQGIGNLDILKPIKFNIDKTKIFAQKVIKEIKLTKDGYIGSWSQKFAFVAGENFVIPKISIGYYDLKEKRLKKLVVKETKVQVNKAYKKENLVDAQEKKFVFTYDFIYYVLIFIAGYIFAKIRFKKEFRRKIKDDSFEQKIQNAKSLKKLITILALKDSKKYENIILDIENEKITSLKECKKIVLD